MLRDYKFRVSGGFFLTKKCFLNKNNFSTQFSITAILFLFGILFFTNLQMIVVIENWVEKIHLINLELYSPK
jgi:hypothetical protein